MPTASIMSEQRGNTTVDWSLLPKEVLRLIVEHVEQKDRVGHAKCVALVDNTFAEAAAAATDSIILEQQCTDISSLQLWLNNHGAGLTQLHMVSAPDPLELPCPKLADLLLQGQSVLASPGLLAMLASLPSLRQLTLKQDFYNRGDVPWPHNLLQQLPAALTRLELYGCLSDRALQGLGSLTNCSHLVLACTEHTKMRVEGLVGLQELQCLTHLHLQGLSGVMGRTTNPGFSRLTRLKHLQLQAAGPAGGCSVEPLQLAGMTHLERLSLEGVWIESADKEGSPAAELFSVLPLLQQLTRLDLPINIHRETFRWDEPLETQAAAYTALVAGSSLQELHFSRRSMGIGAPTAMRRAIWQNIFSAGRKLTALTSLGLYGAAPPLTYSGVQSMSQCCVALKELDIRFCLVVYNKPDPQMLSPLLQLTALTKLLVRMGDSDVAVVSQLGSLRALSAHSCMSHWGLQQLSALQQLTSLGLLQMGDGLKAFKASLVQHNKVDGYYTLTNTVRGRQGKPSSL